MIKVVSQALVVFVAKLISGVRVEWHDELSADAAPRVYFANHGSHLDFAVIWSALPKPIRERTRVIAAGDYWEKTRLRRFLVCTVFNAVLVDRTRVGRGANPVDAFAEVLQGGCSIIIFPEGTRSLDGEVGEFKSGLFHLAKRVPDVPLVPVHLENLNRILPKGEFLPVPILSWCNFGPPLSKGESEGKTEFLSRMREVLLTLSHGNEKPDDDGK